MCIISFCVIRIFVKTFFKNQGIFGTHLLCAFDPLFDYTAMIRVAIGRNLYVRTPVNFTRLHEIEAIMNEVSRVNVKLTEFQLRACLQGEKVTLVLGLP